MFSLKQIQHLIQFPDNLKCVKHYSNILYSINLIYTVFLYNIINNLNCT